MGGCFSCGGKHLELDESLPVSKRSGTDQPKQPEIKPDGVLMETCARYPDATALQWGHLSPLSCITSVTDRLVVTAEAEYGTIKVWQLVDATSKGPNVGSSSNRSTLPGGRQVKFQLIQQLQGHAPDKGILAMDSIVIRPLLAADSDDEDVSTQSHSLHASSFGTPGTRGSNALGLPQLHSEAGASGTQHHHRSSFLHDPKPTLPRAQNNLADHFPNPSETQVLLATSSYDMTIRIWDLTTGRCIRTFFRQKPAQSLRLFQAAPAPVPSDAKSSGSKQFVSDKSDVLIVWSEQDDPRIRIFSFSTRNRETTSMSPPRVSSARGSFSVPEHTSLASKDDRDDESNGSKQAPRPKPSISSSGYNTLDSRGSIDMLNGHSAPVRTLVKLRSDVGFQGIGSDIHLATGCDAGEISFWNLNLRTSMRRLSLPQDDPVHTMSGCAEGDLLLAVGVTGSVYVIDTRTAQLLRKIAPLNLQSTVLNCVCAQVEPVSLLELARHLKEPIKHLTARNYRSTQDDTDDMSLNDEGPEEPVTRSRKGSVVDRPNQIIADFQFTLSDEMCKHLSTPKLSRSELAKLPSGVRKAILLLLTRTSVYQRVLFLPHVPPTPDAADIVGGGDEDSEGTMGELWDGTEGMLKPLALCNLDPAAISTRKKKSQDWRHHTWVLYGIEEAIAATNVGDSGVD